MSGEGDGRPADPEVIEQHRLVAGVGDGELPEVGRSVKAGEAIAVVESVKAASDVYAPVAGEIAAANAQVTEAPEKVNADAYGNWLYKIKPANAGDVDKLLDAAGYTKAVAAE